MSKRLLYPPTKESRSDWDSDERHNPNSKTISSRNATQNATRSGISATKCPLSSQKCPSATTIGKTGENRGSEVQSAFCEVQSTFGRASYQVGCETCGNWRIGFPDQASPKLAKLAVDSVCVCHAGGSRRFSVSQIHPTGCSAGWGQKALSTSRYMVIL